MLKMKYKIKINYESMPIEAKNEEEALNKFWEMQNDIQTNVDNFIDDITRVEEVK